MNNELMVFVIDDDSVATARNWAERQGFPSEVVRKGGAETFASMLEAEPPPKIVFVDIENQNMPAQAIIRLCGMCGQNTKIIAIGSTNDVGVFRDLLTAGASDYIVKPLSAETLTHAFTSAMKGKSSEAGVREAKVIIVFGIHGGVGASTLAINIGWFAAHELKKKTALIDLDLQFGTSALALDIEPGHGLRDIVSSPQRVDSLMVSGAVVNESENFSVLSAEEAIDEIIHVDSSATSLLIREMRPNYRVIIVDLPNYMFATQKRLFVLANEIVLVTEMTLAGIRDTLRVRNALKSLGVNARTTIVAGKSGAQRPTGVDEATFAKGAQAKIDFFIPDDPKNIAAASNAGKTLGAIAKNSPLAKSFLQLTKYLLESEAEKIGKEKSRRGIFAGLFSGQKQADNGAA